MRIGELKALNWNDIDFSKRALWVKKQCALYVMIRAHILRYIPQKLSMAIELFLLQANA